MPRVPRDRWIYPIATIAVGLIWYLAFVLTPSGKELMTEQHLLLAGDSVLVPFLCFPLTSLLLGLASWPLFRWCRWRTSVWVGLGTSFLGSILYVWLVFLASVAFDAMDGGELESIKDFDARSLIAITVIGPVVALWYGLVTVPAAIVSGLFLHWAARLPATQAGAQA